MNSERLEAPPSTTAVVMDISAMATLLSQSDELLAIVDTIFILICIKELVTSYINSASLPKP